MRAAERGNAQAGMCRIKAAHFKTKISDACTVTGHCQEQWQEKQIGEKNRRLRLAKRHTSGENMTCKPRKILAYPLDIYGVWVWIDNIDG